ncbi:MAG: hypothetical protein ABSH32_21645 [Bryobacteraceae bacterium]|jgi:hypothetical protein
MSTDEQDLVLGRLIREERECRVKIGAIEANLRAFSESLNSMYLTLNGVWTPKPNPVTTIEQALDALMRMPASESIMGALKELRAERERSETLRRQLQGMGM